MKKIPKNPPIKRKTISILCHRSLSCNAFQMQHKLNRPLSMHVVCICSLICMCEHAHRVLHCLPYLLNPNIYPPEVSDMIVVYNKP